MTTPNAPRPPVRVFRRGLVYGTLWGLGITASEVLVLPFGPLSTAPASALMLHILWRYAVTGMLLAWAILVLEPRLDRWWKVALASIAAALLASGLNALSWVAGEAMGFTDLRAVIGESGSSWSHRLYVFWIVLVHGGIFMVACVLAARAERSRHLFAAAQIARAQTEALLDKTDIEALYGQIEPSFLMRAMRTVRDRTATDPAGAERLLDGLVAFLRLAMPGVRSGSSTLAAELQLADAYARLLCEIDPHGARWKIDADPALPEMPFPPLLLLPLLDAVAAPGGPGGPLMLQARLHRERRRMTLAVVAQRGTTPAIDLPPALRYGMRVALQATLGDGWQLNDGASGAPPADAPAILLTVDARVPAPHPPASEPLPSALSVAAAVLHEMRAASLLIPGAPR